MLYAVYSAMQAKRIGTVIYQRPDGSEVAVTEVSSLRNIPGNKWPDKQDLGEVTILIREALEVDVEEGFNIVELVSIFENQVVEITDVELVELCNVVGAEGYQKFIKAAENFARRLNPR